MVTVTAVITTFNRSHFLGQAIDSVLGQTYRDFELLILDNSSEDDTESLVASYDDLRIRYIRHESMPISPQRNMAVREARGEFIAFLDDDDLWLSNKLQAQMEVMSGVGPNVALVYGGYQFFDENGMYARQKAQVRGRVLRDLLLGIDGFCGSASNPLLRRSAVLAVGGYEDDVISGEDYHLYLKLSRDWDVEITEAFVVSIRQHSGPRLIGRWDERIRLEERILKEFSDSIDDEIRVRFLKMIGGKHIRYGSAREGRKFLCKALSIRFWDMVALGQYVCSFLGARVYSLIHSFVIARMQNRYLEKT